MNSRYSRKWSSLALLFLAGALNYADRTAVSSLFPLLQRDLALSDVGLAAVGSLFLWSYAAGSPFAGMLADRFSRCRMIVFSLVCWSVATALSGLVTDAWQLYGLRLLLGLSECLYLPAAAGWIADQHEPGTRATALSIHAASLNFGMVAGGTLAGYLGDRAGWRPAFFVLGGAGLLLSVALTAWLRDRNDFRTIAPAMEPPLATLKALSKMPAYGCVLAEAGLIAIGSWIFANWLPLYFRETYGLSLAEAGFTGTFSSTAGAVAGMLAGGYLSDRFAAHNPRRRLLIQGIFYLISVPLLFAFAMQPPARVLGGAILLHGFIRAMGGANEVPLLCDLLPPHRRSTGMGLMNASNTFIGGSGVLLSGLLKSGSGLLGVFTLMPAIILAASAVCLISYRYFLPGDLARIRQSMDAANTRAER